MTPTADTQGFRMWVRRVSDENQECALRFRTEHGKGVLRVSRPGVLIVPPARTSGFEDHLSPAQLRSSEFLHIRPEGRRRYRLFELTDRRLGSLDPEVWMELVPSVEDPAQLTLEEHQGVIALGGAAGPRSGEPSSYPDVLPAPEVVFAMPRHASTLDDEVMEAEAAEDEEEEEEEEEVGDPGSESAAYAGAVGTVEDFSDVMAAVRLGGDPGDDEEEILAAEPDTEPSFTYESFVLLGDPPSADEPFPRDPDANGDPVPDPNGDPQGRTEPVHRPATAVVAPVEHAPAPASTLPPDLPTEPPTEPPDELPTEPPAPVTPASVTPARVGAVPASRADPPADPTDLPEPHELESATPPASAVAPPPELRGPGRILVRHLRSELYGRRLEAYDMKIRLQRLEARLRALGEDPDAIASVPLPDPEDSGA